MNDEQMRAVAIGAADFPDANSLVELYSSLQVQVYKFFKSHEPYSNYVFTDLTLADANKIVVGDVNELRSFGIYFSNSQIKSTKERFLLILSADDVSSVEAFNLKCANFIKQIHGMKVTDIVIEKTAFSKREIEEIANLVGSRFPMAKILNKQFANITIVQDLSHSTRKVNGLETVELTSCVSGLGANFSTNVRSYYNIVNAFYNAVENAEKQYKGRVVFTYTRGLLRTGSEFFKRACEHTFIRVALYFILTSSYKFDIPDDLFQLFRLASHKLFSQESLFASDWLKMIQNPCCIGLKYSNNDYFVCARKPHRDNNSTVTILQSKFTEDGRNSRFDYDSFDTRTYNVSEIRIRSIQEIYDVVSPDYSVAKDAFNSLNMLCREFNRFLIEKLDSALEIPVSLNNLVVFERSGNTYLGYIQTTKVSIAYSVKHLQSPMRAFEYELKEPGELLDICSVVDSEMFNKMCANFGIQEIDKHWHLSNTLKGVLINAIPASAGSFIQEIFEDFTFAEVCQYAAIPTQLRGSSVVAPLKFLNIDEAYKNGILTYFGGVCPHTRELNISSKVWR